MIMQTPKELNQEETILYALKGMLSEMPAAEQARVNECITKMRQAMAGAGEVMGAVALALIGAEASASSAKEANRGD